MRSYTVFDCTTLSQDTDVVIFGPAVLARAVAFIRTALTRRFHDFSLTADSHHVPTFGA